MVFFAVFLLCLTVTGLASVAIGFAARLIGQHRTPADRS